jgi:hypothetical protein
MMNKLIVSFVSVMGLLIVPVHSSAQTPADYFKAGQFDEFSNYIGWLKVYSPDDLKAKFDSGRQLFVKAGAPDKVLASLDSMSKTMVGLPLTTGYNTWTKAQQDAWNSSGLDGNALNGWLGQIDTPTCFFFWLGYESMRLGKAVPAELNDWNSGLASAQSTAKPALQEFTVFRDSAPTVFKTLSPDVQAAIKAIAKYNEQAVDPMGNGLSKDDFTAVAAQAAIINNAASAGKLTQ